MQNVVLLFWSLIGFIKLTNIMEIVGVSGVHTRIRVTLSSTVCQGW